MLDANMQGQLKQYLANLREPIELVATLDDSDKSAQTRELLNEIADLHDMVTARFDGANTRVPSFDIVRSSDANASVTFAGLPMGHEFTSLVLALLWTGGHPPKVDADAAGAQRIRVVATFHEGLVLSLGAHLMYELVHHRASPGLDPATCG